MIVLSETDLEYQRTICIRFAANHPKLFLKIVMPVLFQKAVPLPPPALPRQGENMTFTRDGDGFISLRFSWDYNGQPPLRMSEKVFNQCIDVSKKYLKTNQIIQAIKEVRALCSLGLKESKAFVDTVKTGQL